MKTNLIQFPDNLHTLKEKAREIARKYNIQCTEEYITYCAQTQLIRNKAHAKLRNY